MLQAVREVLGTSDWAAAQRLLQHVRQAPKLAALRDVLCQCGIIASADEAEGGGGGAGAGASDDGGSSGGHRVLVFAQLKGTLDIVERDVMQRCASRTVTTVFSAVN